jgi:hypothetical protein
VPSIPSPKLTKHWHSFRGARQEGGGFGVPQDIVLPTTTTEFLGKKIACPRQPDVYLELLYGNFKKIEYTYVAPAAAKVRAKMEADADPASI